MQITTSAEHFIERPESRHWIRRLAKFGYAMKGAVHAVMGVLVLQAALGNGGQLAGERQAVEHIGRQPFGQFALIAVGVGLLGYAVWRAVEAILDPYRRGSEAKGIAVRIGVFASGLLSGAVGVAGLQLALGNARSGGEPNTWVSSLLAQPWGAVVIALLGLVVIGVGVHHIYSAYSDHFAKHLDTARLTPNRRKWIFWSGRVGYAARGVVFGIIGVALVQAGLNADASRAKGFSEALHELAAQPFGQTLLVLVAVGFIAYAVHLITTVPYRRLV